jgi:hypothetical protein
MVFVSMTPLTIITRTATLYLGERLSTKLPVACLRDGSGRWGGVLRFHNRHELYHADQALDWHEMGCYLAAISTGNIFNNDYTATRN